MNRTSALAATIALATAAALGGCATPTIEPPGTTAAQPAIAAPSCATASATLRFDFAGASPARCVIMGEREFALVISPEHAPPINPSPWYAFRYSSSEPGGITIHLRYLEAHHRYSPKLTRNGKISGLPVTTATDGSSATFLLPAGEGTVSAQPVLATSHYTDVARRLTTRFDGQRLELGRSLDQRPVEGLHFGAADAPRLVVILGRQHPPEVTGAFALEPFLEELLTRLQRDSRLHARYQILAVPLLNPDGVAMGHWRANRGGADLNRDWGPFTQPETRAVRDWLKRLPSATTPVAMLDFHSTQRNLFYVQGDEADAVGEAFLTRWLVGRERQLADYPFTIERRNNNPGSGTAKNWFFERFAIPAYTYEVGDDTDPAATAAAARILAAEFLVALESVETQ
ncbi:M14 family metallopeptidase [Parasphingorhabdus sp.]|uniref:M14 family metallopeptidase n=1 Tax=Parasphingorhabdus sp. TaxID=2709688 RepID=UPI003A937D50